MRDTDDEIDRALTAAAWCEQASDDAFASGDPINGFKFFRWRCLAMTRADELAHREFDHPLRRTA